MSEATFLKRWRADLVSGEIGVQLADVEHPLEVYVGASDLGQPRLQVRSPLKPMVPSLSDIVLVDRRKSGDSWLLSLTLQDSRFTEVFMRLVAHAVAASRAAESEEKAWAAVGLILDEWKRLLRARPKGLLSVDEIRGLCAEMWLLLNRFMETLPVDQALAGWLGPFNAPQDFWYEQSGFHEIKAIGPSAPRITISSEAQLDPGTMELVVVHAPQVSESAPGALNLAQLVGDLLAGLDQAGLPHDDAEIRLRHMGVDIDQPFYADTWFAVTQVDYYNVTADFPAIRESQLPSGLGRVKYQLERAALAPFLASSEIIS